MLRSLSALVVVAVVFGLASAATSINVRSMEVALPALAADLSPSERRAESAALFIEMGRVIEMTIAFAKALEQIGPDRLEDIHRIKLGPDSRGELPPHHHVQKWLIGQKSLFGSSGIPADQFLQ